MSFAAYVYFIDLLGKFNAMAGTFSLFGAVLLVIGGAAGYMAVDGGYGDTSGKKQKLFRILRRGAFVWAISLALFIITPDKPTLYTMVAANQVQVIAENPDVQKLAGSSLKVIEKKMQEYLAADEEK